MKQMALVKKLLKLMTIPQVYGIPTTAPEAEVSRYLRSVIPALKEDELGNLYLINEGTPLICAHMDTVGSIEAQTKLDRLRVVKPGEGIGRYKEDGQEIINHYTSSVVIGDDNIGADDKCGLAIALELYEKLGNRISLLFTVQEESGMIGATGFDKELLDKCSYAIIPDRRNGTDIIGVGNEYCTEEFEDIVSVIGKRYGYEPALGMVSDCDIISDTINCINISVGYYEAHTSKEYVILDEFERAYHFAYDIVTNYNEKLDPPVKEFDYRRSSFVDYGYYVEDPIEVYGDEMIVNKSVEITNAETGKRISLSPGFYIIN